MNKKIGIVLIVSLVLLLCQTEQVKANPDFLSGYAYRKTHEFGNATGAGINYPVRIIVHYGSGSDSGENVYCSSKCKTDFGDIRFTDNDEITLLSYWMEVKTDSDNATFWVKVADDLSTTNATIYIYYGKADATTTSDISTIGLEWYDDAESGTATSKWVDDTPSYETTSSIYQGSKSLHLGDSNVNTDCSGFTSGHDRAVEIWFYDNGGTDDSAKIFSGTSLSDGWGALIAIHTDQSTTHYSYYYAGGVWTVSSIARSDGWHRATFGYDGSGVNLYIDGTEITTGVGGNDIDAVRVWRLTLGSPNQRWDAIIIRKYVFPEPAHGSWGNEESNVKSVLCYYTQGGQLEIDGVLTANGTTKDYSPDAETTLKAYPDGSMLFINWTWNGNTNATNPYNLTVSDDYTLWCYFDSPPEAPPVTNWMIIPLVFGLAAIALVLKYRQDGGFDE